MNPTLSAASAITIHGGRTRRNSVFSLKFWRKPKMTIPAQTARAMKLISKSSEWDIIEFGSWGQGELRGPTNTMARLMPVKPFVFEL